MRVCVYACETEREREMRAGVGRWEWGQSYTSSLLTLAHLLCCEDDNRIKIINNPHSIQQSSVRVLGKEPLRDSISTKYFQNKEKIDKASALRY